MKYPYDTRYEPPFPAVPISLVNKEESLTISVDDALLDTGADGTLVPIAHLQEILAPALTDARIRSHWGEWRIVQLFAVNIEFGDLSLTNMFVIGDEQGEDVILGRNVLNKLRLLLDGPSSLMEML